MRTTLALLIGGALLAAGATPAAALGAAREGHETDHARSSAVSPCITKGAAAASPSCGQATGKRTGTGRGALDRQAAIPAPLLIDEDEPDDILGSNESTATAQPISRFGTAAGKRNRARVLGTLSPEIVDFHSLLPSAEDDGSIPQARPTGIGTVREGIATTGSIGDGPHGSARGGTGDFDFYRLVASTGETLNIDIDAGTSSLDSMVAIYTPAGDMIGFNDDDRGNLESLLRMSIPATGTYYVLVTGFSVLPGDPHDPASGARAESEGSYGLRISLAEPDRDVFALRLRKGDVLGASVTGGTASLAIYDPSPRREVVHGWFFDASYLYPPTSPLPGGGNAVTEHVADQDGWHYIRVETGSGDYDVTVEAYRSPLEEQGAVQTLFLDFDGGLVDTAVFGGPGVVELSPLEAFLGRWSLRSGDLGALIDGIVAEVRENVQTDAIARGGNPNFAVRILNSRDHADPFGRPNVSRVVVGGTYAEAGVVDATYQAIDPGNFDTEETALLLLDELSAPRHPRRTFSLNTFLRPQSDRVGFVAQGLGNMASHELGHLLGSWHTHPTNARPNLMDARDHESYPSLFGVGPDGVGGTADDVDVDFGEDVYEEGSFFGTQDTLTRTAFGLTTD